MKERKGMGQKERERAKGLEEESGEKERNFMIERYIENKVS